MEEVVWCPLDPNPLPLNYRQEEESGLYYAGDYQLRRRMPGAGVDICFGGRIAVTAVWPTLMRFWLLRSVVLA